MGFDDDPCITYLKNNLEGYLRIKADQFNIESEMYMRLNNPTGNKQPSQGIQDLCNAIRNFKKYAENLYKEKMPLDEQFTKLNFSKDKKELTQDELKLYVTYSYEYKTIKNTSMKNVTDTYISIITSLKTINDPFSFNLIPEIERLQKEHDDLIGDISDKIKRLDPYVRFDEDRLNARVFPVNSFTFSADVGHRGKKEKELNLLSNRPIEPGVLPPQSPSNRIPNWKGGTRRLKSKRCKNKRVKSRRSKKSY